MRCRNCGGDPADRAVLRLSGLLRAARGRVRLRGRRRDADPRGDRGARARDLALRRAAARSTRRRRAACRSARRRCWPADRLAPALGLDRLWIKDDTRNPSLVFKDRAVAVAAARAVEFGVEALACASTGNLAGATAAAAAARRAAGLRLHPGRPRAGQGRPRAGLRRDGRPDRRAPTTTSTGCASRSPTRPAGASSTSTCGRSTPRAPRRSPTRSPSRSAGARPTSSSRPVASGAMFTRVARGFEELAELGLIERPADPLRRRPGRRLRAGRDGVGGRDRRHRAGPDARTRSSARWPSATRPTAATRSSWPTRPAARSRRSTTR